MGPIDLIDICIQVGACKIDKVIYSDKWGILIFRGPKTETESGGFPRSRVSTVVNYYTML